jgi:uncharacterized protein (TIGR03118 family)
MYMKTILRHNYVPGLLLVASFLIIISGCQKTADTSLQANQAGVSDLQANSLSLGNFKQVNLNANTSSYGAPHINQRLQNAWGMAVASSGPIWVCANHSGLSFVYDDRGHQLIPPVSIPSNQTGVPGSPTGQVFNATTDFVIPGTGNPAKFIFAGEDGTISAWNGGSAAIIVVDRSKAGVEYKGITMANDGGANFLYAANFTNHKVDVFDKNFKRIFNKPFNDPGIPSGYGPFNVSAINGMLYVTYALVKVDGDDSAGLGHGYVDVYFPNGTLSNRIASQGTLNSPWGLAEGFPALIGMDALLVGNFGDGRINVFDWNGNFKGQLMNGGTPIVIDGLWALNDDIPNTWRRQLYFTAGPNDEADGVFGYLLKGQ